MPVVALTLALHAALPAARAGAAAAPPATVAQVAAAARAPGAAVTTAPAPFPTLQDLDAALDDLARGADADAFWARVKAAAAMPLVFGDTAVFLHRSDASGVEWRGDFNDWSRSPAATGERVGQTNVWTWRRRFPPRTRLDYKIVETREAWMVDPLNPRSQLGGYGPNSVVQMPGYVAPTHLARRDGVARGRLHPLELVPSERLGYEVGIRVYEPARPTRRALPVLYVTDGSDYWHEQMGRLDVTLDNLVADGRLPPLLVVFVDPWDAEHRVNRRETEMLPGGFPPRADAPCAFCDFLDDELAPRVESRFRVDGSRRGILGTSFGGFHAALMGLRYPTRFSLVGIQSPYVAEWLPQEVGKAATQPRRVVLDVGSFEEGGRAHVDRLRRAYEARGVGVRFVEPPDGHSWGHWSATVAEVLEYLFGPRQDAPERQRPANE